MNRAETHVPGSSEKKLWRASEWHGLWKRKAQNAREAVTEYTLQKFGGRGGLTPPRIRVSGYAEYKFLVRGIL